MKPQPKNNGEKVGREKTQGGSERDPRIPLSLDYHLQQMKPGNSKHFVINKAQNSENHRVIIVLAIESKILV